jgi:hypothetical protein
VHLYPRKELTSVVRLSSCSVLLYIFEFVTGQPYEVILKFSVTDLLSLSVED